MAAADTRDRAPDPPSTGRRHQRGPLAAVEPRRDRRDRDPRRGHARERRPRRSGFGPRLPGGGDRLRDDPVGSADPGNRRAGRVLDRQRACALDRARRAVSLAEPRRLRHQDHARRRSTTSPWWRTRQRARPGRTSRSGSRTPRSPAQPAEALAVSTPASQAAPRSREPSSGRRSHVAPSSASSSPRTTGLSAGSSATRPTRGPATAPSTRRACPTAPTSSRWSPTPGRVRPGTT